MKALLASQLGRNILSGPLSAAVNVLLVLLGYPIYLRFLGYKPFGVWLLLSSVVAFIQLTNLGLGPALTTLVAETRGRADDGALKGYASTATLALAVLGLLGTAMALLMSEPILSIARLEAESLGMARSLLPWAGLLTVTAFLAQASTAVLAGLGRMDLAVYLDSSSRVGSLALSVGLLAAGWKVEALIAGTAVSQVVVVVGSHWYVVRITGSTVLEWRSAQARWLRPLWRQSHGILIGSLANVAQHPLNRFAIARWSAIENVVVYDIAFSGAMQVRALFEAAGRAIAPEVSRARAALGGLAVERVRHLKRGVMSLYLAVALPVWIGIELGADFLLRLWLAGRFQDGITGVFRLMLVGAFVSLMGVPSFHAAIGLGRTRVIAVGQVLSTSLNAAVVLAWVGHAGRLTPMATAFAVLLATAATTAFYSRASKQIVGTLEIEDGSK